MADEPDDNSKDFDRIGTAKLKPEEVEVPSLEDLRRAVQQGDYVIDFERLAQMMSRKLR